MTKRARKAPYGDARRAYDRVRARGLFLAAVAEHTKAWLDLRARCESARKAIELKTGEVASTFTPRVRAICENRRQVIGAEWARHWNLDVSWVAKWVFPTIPERWVLLFEPLNDFLLRETHTVLIWVTPPWLPSEVKNAWRHDTWFDEAKATCFRNNVESQYFADFEAATRGLLDAKSRSMLFEWQADEVPPNPLQEETREEFLKRMEEGWRRRVAFIEATGLTSQPSVRKPMLHAEWFARHQVGRTPVSTILNDHPDTDRSTVLKALRSFSDLIEIPRRSGD